MTLTPDQAHLVAEHTNYGAFAMLLTVVLCSAVLVTFVIEGRQRKGGGS